MDPDPTTKGGIAFGRFCVLPHRRELLADDQPTKLGGRAFDVLVALVEARGAVVSKDELMARVWPGRIVDENALQSQIVALRRVFGPDRDLIRTVSGRGYQFTGEIRMVSAMSDRPATAEIPQPTASRPPTNLPEAVSELIGREADLDKVLYLSTSHRLVTLTGAGGIGKTRLGFEVARHLLPRFADGIWAIELAPLSDPELVPVTVATALGLELASGGASPLSVATALRAKQLMLVLDNCEHVVDAAAQMAEALLRANPAARVIATSREPLRTEGEWVYPVPPLAVPAEGSPIGENKLSYGAVLLFVERARAREPQFGADRRIVGMIVTICRQLDGIPLAIELAAARAAALGIEGLAAGLDDRFRLLAGGRRTALPRHQTLRATLDWSYGLLSEDEKRFFRRLGIFSANFSIETAARIIMDAPEPPVAAADRLADLAAKSLLSANIGGAEPQFRLPETTRLYALEKLDESGERQEIARRYAEFYQDLFERAANELKRPPTTEWLVLYGSQIDSLRAALDWAFSPSGDGSIGVALTAAAVPLWMQLSLLEECRSRVEQALTWQGREALIDARGEMKLQAALGASLLFTKGAVPAAVQACTVALRLAESLGDTEHQLRALWEIWVYRTNTGEHAAALAVAQQFYILALEHADPATPPIADRMIGMSYHYLGDQTNAWRHIDRMMRAAVDPQGRSLLIRFWFDQEVAGRVVLARILWLQGFADQAWRTVQSAVGDAEALADPATLCYALSHGGCLLALWVGNLARQNVTRKCCSIIRVATALRPGMISPLVSKGLYSSRPAISTAGRRCFAPALTRSPIPTPASGS